MTPFPLRFHSMTSTVNRFSHSSRHWKGKRSVPCCLVLFSVFR
jgi:hypothetical protein